MPTNALIEKIYTQDPSIILSSNFDSTRSLQLKLNWSNSFHFPYPNSNFYFYNDCYFNTDYIYMSMIDYK